MKLTGICPFCDKENNFNITQEEFDNDFHMSCTFCDKETAISGYQCFSKNREKAIAILEAIAEKFGNEDMFDSKQEMGEPDGTWYEYEDLVTEILDK